MLDNRQVAILMKVNELGRRYGLEPHQFLTTLQVDPESADSELQYCGGPGGYSGDENDKLWDRYKAMLGNLNLADGGSLFGDDRELCRCLDEALQRAPRPRSR